MAAMVQVYRLSRKVTPEPVAADSKYVCRINFTSEITLEITLKACHSDPNGIEIALRCPNFRGVLARRATKCPSGAFEPVWRVYYDLALENS